MATLDDERIRISFEKVRKDLDFLKNEIESIKNDLVLQNKEKNTLKNQISNILSSITEINNKTSLFFKSSSGNHGAINDEQQLTTMINNDQQINNIKKDFEDQFRSLTDREFSIFMTIYQLEEDLQGPVSYYDVSKTLKVTETNIRIHVNSMLNKGIPLEKSRQYNRKVSLSIKKDLRDLNLASKLLKLRQGDSNTQITLFDMSHT